MNVPPIPTEAIADRIHPNYNLHRNCVELCQRSEKVWHDLGHYDVKFWPEETYPQHFKVASNLINGLPPSANKRQAAA